MIEKILEILPISLRDEAVKATAYAEEKHGGQFRIGGEPYANHVFRVAEAAAEHALAAEMPPETVRILAISALLHDVVEDTDATIEDVEELFGKDVARVVLALSHEDEDELDEIYLARVAEGGELAILVKRYDKLDNIVSLPQAPADFRRRKLSENREALPLWNRMDPEGAALIEELLKEIENG